MSKKNLLTSATGSPVRSAVRENVLCSLAILSSQGSEIMGPVLEPTVL